MDYLQHIANIENLENAEVPPQPRNRINNIDPFHLLSEHQFIQMFRLSKDLVRYLIELLTPHMRPQNRMTDLSITTRILVAVRFFASGGYQMDIARNLFVSVSQPSASRCIEEVSFALNEDVIFSQWVRFPRNFEELNAVRQKFHEDHNFPGVVGCIDCTHVAIHTPKVNDEEHPEHIYVNRKGYHSINVQLICDSKLKITNVLARYPGSTHDAYIWRNSNVLQMMRNLHAEGYLGYYLLGTNIVEHWCKQHVNICAGLNGMLITGDEHSEDSLSVFVHRCDSGYPLRTWLLTPFDQEPPEGTPEHTYNRRQRSTRNTIERCNGVLKMRFRCLCKDRALHYKPPVVCRIINACVILHNMCIEYHVPPVRDDEQVDVDMGIFVNHNDEDEDNPAQRVNPELKAGRRARRRLINTFFNN